MQNDYAGTMEQAGKNSRGKSRTVFLQVVSVELRYVVLMSVDAPMPFPACWPIRA